MGGRRDNQGECMQTQGERANHTQRRARLNSMYLHRFYKRTQYVYQPFPATLSDNGKPYACQKSQLASSLETNIRSPDQEPDTDVIIILGSAMGLWRLRSTGSSTNDTCFHYEVQVNTTHIVFVCTVHQAWKWKQGQWCCWQVTDKNSVPSNWCNFLINNDNKITRPLPHYG